MQFLVCQLKLITVIDNVMIILSLKPVSNKSQFHAHLLYNYDVAFLMVMFQCVTGTCFVCQGTYKG